MMKTNMNLIIVQIMTRRVMNINIIVIVKIAWAWNMMVCVILIVMMTNAHGIGNELAQL